MFGPGKYDELLIESLKKVKALRGVLIVLDGEKGPGFSAKLADVDFIKMPNTLRNIANQIEKDHNDLRTVENDK